VVGDTRVRHVYDLSPAEEVLAGVTAAGVTVALRGLYDVVPFFLSIALGIVTSAVAVTLSRLARRRDVTFLKRSLRRGTRLTGAGVVFLAASAAWLALLGHGGIVRWNVWAGIRAHERGEDTVALGRLERAWDLGLFPTPRAEALLADIHAASAKAAFDAGQPRKALHHLARIVVLRPASVEARCELGAILVETGELGAAIAHLREAVRLDPGHARSHHNLAVALAMGGAADEALRHAERASSLAPDDAQARAFRDHLIRVKGR
jgi:tetratricopeptide (TPR) repeat protein